MAANQPNNRPFSTLHSPDEPQASQYSLHTPVESVSPNSFHGDASPSAQHEEHYQPQQHQQQQYHQPGAYIQQPSHQPEHYHQQQQPPANLYYPPPPNGHQQPPAQSVSPVSPNTYYVAQYSSSPPPQLQPLPSPRSPSFAPPPQPASPYNSPPTSPGFPPSAEHYAMQSAPHHSSPPVDFRSHTRTPTPPHPGYLGHPTPTGTPVQQPAQFQAQPQPQQANGHGNGNAMATTAVVRPPMPPEPIHTPGYNGSDSTGPQTPKTPVYTPGGAAGPNGGVHAPGQIAHPNQQLGQDEYHHGLCDCFSDIGTCCTGYWCPCILYSRTHHRLKTVPNSNLNGFKSCNTDCALFCIASPISCKSAVRKLEGLG